MKTRNKRKVVAFLFSVQDSEVDAFKIGVLQYARPSKDWAFIPCSESNMLNDLTRKDGMFDGGIGEFGRPDLWHAALEASFPAVNLYGGRGFHGLPTVGIDDRAIGRMAARHLMEQGLRHFAYFGLNARGFSGWSVCQNSCAQAPGFATTTTDAGGTTTLIPLRISGPLDSWILTFSSLRLLALGSESLS